MEHDEVATSCPLVDVSAWLAERRGAAPDQEWTLDDLSELFETPPPTPSPAAVYRVWHLDVGKTALRAGVTEVLPGRIGREFHMTRGHAHRNRGANEFYVGIEGTGVVLLADNARRSRCIELRRGRIVHVPPLYAHRVANTGSDTLVFFWTCGNGYDNDYDVARSGFPARVVHADGGFELVGCDAFEPTAPVRARP